MRPRGPIRRKWADSASVFLAHSDSFEGRRNYKAPTMNVTRIGRRRRKGSDAKRSRARPGHGLLPIPYPSIVELRRAEFSESPSQGPREREDSDVLGRSGRSARARVRTRSERVCCGASLVPQPCFKIRSGRKIGIADRAYFT